MSRFSSGRRRFFRPLAPAGWNARFGRELNVTDDREHFGPPGRGLPVVEGKQIEPFRVDLHAARFSLSAAKAKRLLESGRYGPGALPTATSPAPPIA